MKIDYILSDTTKSASSRAIEEVIRRAEEEPFSDFVVIVPETKSIIIEKEILGKSKHGATMNISVYSFVRLLRRVGGVDTSKVLSKQACIIILRKLIFDLSAQLDCYKKTAKSVGFAEKMYETIQQLKASQISAEELAGISVSDASLAHKLKDIALIYAEYEKFLSDKYLDDCDRLALLNQFATTSDTLKNANIFVVGFDNITGEMQQVFKQLAINCKSITFSCVYFDKAKLSNYIFSNELYNKFKRIADDLKYPYVPIKHSAKFKGDFYRIANNLFAKGNGYTSDGSVTIYEAKSEKEEVEFIANQIHLQVSGGKRYKDIGVLACNLAETSELVKEVFDDYQIPYFINESYQIKNHFLSGFIQSAIQIFSSHLDSKAVLEFLSSPILDISNYGDFQNFVNEVGVDHDEFLTFDLQKNANLVQKYENLSENLEFLRKFYADFAKKFKESKVVSDFVGVLNEVLNSLSVKEKLETISAFERDSALVVDSEITSQIYSKLTVFGELLCNFLGNEEVSMDEFLNLYLTGFDVIKINLAPVSVDCVVVQENTDGFYDIDTMFLMGAVEGSFPCKLADTGIILDDELDKLSQASSKSAEPTVKQINRREEFRAFESLLEPKSKLFVTYSLKSLGGAPTTKASLVENLNELFKEEITQTDFVPSKFVNFKVHEKRFVSHVGKFLQGSYNLSDLNREYSELQGHLSKGVKNYLDSLNFSAPEFKIDSTGLYFYGDKTSVSQLENYFACPYKFFVRYGLRIKKRNDYKLDSMDIGNVIHRLVELFMKQLDQCENISKEQFDQIILKLLYQSLTEYKINITGNQSVIKSLEAEAIRVCEALQKEQQSSNFKNDKDLNEFEFKGKNGIKLELENGKTIVIEGKIDRIDKFQNFIRIIDYKTGKVECSLSPIYFGKKIQLVSYLSAIENIEDKNGKHYDVAGLFYLPIHSDYAKSEKKSKARYRMVGILLDDIDVVKNMDNTLSFENCESNFVPIKILSNADVRRENRFEFSGKNKTTLKKSEIENIKAYTLKLCKTAVDEILDGYIEPSPILLSKNDDLPCVYCEYSGFCGKEKARYPHGRACDDKIEISDFDLEGQDGQE